MGARGAAVRGALLIGLLIAVGGVRAQDAGPGGPLPVVSPVPFIEADARARDLQDGAAGRPPAYGVVLPVPAGPVHLGRTSDAAEGRAVRVCSQGALAVEPFLTDVRLGAGERLRLRDANSLATIVEIPSAEVPANRRLALPPAPGPCCIIEVTAPPGAAPRGTFTVAEVGHTFRTPAWEKAGPCEVDVNCPEGQACADQRDAVVRIGIRANGALYWCSGTLMNNTARDCRPFLLTALHCGMNSTVTDLQDYKFYFGYQRSGCGSGPAPQTQYITGCHRRADSNDGGMDGSDFLLLEALGTIPAGFNPYWAGWDASGAPSSAGVTVHHPDGGEKKVSTYAMNLFTSQWVPGGPWSHWWVKWAATANGHGVTEPGSSGAPLFDAAGRVIGTLSGGTSCCQVDGCGLPGSGPNSPDYFGKMSFHWTQNPNTPAQKLKAWLDPLGLDSLTLGGSRSPCADGIGERTMERFTVHPVPASDRLTVEWGASDGAMDVQLWSADGRLHRSTSATGKAVLDVADLPAGCYVLTLTGPTGARRARPVVLGDP